MPQVDPESLARFVRVVAPQLSEPLTDREALVLYLRIAELMTNHEIADRLFSSGSAVHVHLWRARRKLGRPGLHAFEPMIADYWREVGLAEARAQREAVA